MPLTMPQPDFEPRLALHLRAFRFPTEVEVVPYRTVREICAHEDEDADSLGSERKFRVGQLLMVFGDRR
jgi:hypothetical protein